MLLDELATFLAGQGLGVVATDIFKGIMPDAPVDVPVVAVFETPGDPPSYVLSPTNIQLENPRIAVWVRGTEHDYDTARRKSQDAHDALDTIRNSTLSGTRYLSVKPLQQPFLLERDQGDRPIFAFNAEVTKVPS